MSNDSKEMEIVQTIIQVIKEKNPQTVKELASLVEERVLIPEQEIIQVILKMQSEGKIRLAKQIPLTSPNLVAYLKTRQALWYWITITMAITTTIVVFTIPENFDPWVYIRYILGSVFVLWLPGYAFTKALFPVELPIKTSQKSLEIIELIALSLGMSLALVPMIGLLLNYTPWGIRLTPIVLSLLVLTIVFATVAIVREHQIRIKAEK